MPLKVFPTALLNFEVFEADIERREITGGEALSGETDITATDGGGRWFCEVGNPYLDEPEIALAWTALADNLTAGTPIIVPLTDATAQMMGSVTLPQGGLPWWEEADYGTPDSGVALANDIALRATTLTLTVTFLPQPVRVGMRFSIDHAVLRHRAYRVTELVSDDGAEVVIKFLPPAREATTADTLVDFIDPKCVMHLDGQMRSPRTLGFADSPGARLIENFSGSYS